MKTKLVLSEELQYKVIYLNSVSGNPADDFDDVDMKQSALNNENLSAFDEIWKTNEGLCTAFSVLEFK